MGVKISELNEATSAQNSDVIPIVQNEETKKISVETLGIANAVEKSDLLDLIYPVGSIYMSVNNTSPATLFGGTWEAIGGRFLLGADTTYSAGSIGGEETHTLTINEMPSHSHGIRTNSVDGDIDWVPKDHKANVHVSELNFNWAGSVISTTGGGQAHNNMPPYLAVYMWKRIS